MHVPLLAFQASHLALASNWMAQGASAMRPRLDSSKNKSAKCAICRTRTSGVVASGGLLVETVQLKEDGIVGPLAESLHLGGSLVEVLLERHVVG